MNCLILNVDLLVSIFEFTVYLSQSGHSGTFFFIPRLDTHIFGSVLKLSLYEFIF